MPHAGLRGDHKRSRIVQFVGRTGRNTRGEPGARETLFRTGERPNRDVWTGPPTMDG